MPYRFLEDIAIADVAFTAWAQSPEELFTAAVEAYTNVMVDNPEAIACLQAREIVLDNEALDLLLYELLQELIFLKDSQGLLVRMASIRIGLWKQRWKLSARVCGEEIDPSRHHLRVDVKAVTLHRFSVSQSEQQWQATVVLDI